MFHLVQDAVSGIDANLAWVKSVRDSLFSWWFNVIALVVVVGGFACFLYMSHGSGVPAELEKVPFEARTWNNAVRNVPTTEYGQTPQTENGDFIPGLSRRTGATAF